MLFFLTFYLSKIPESITVSIKKYVFNIGNNQKCSWAQISILEWFLKDRVTLESEAMTQSRECLYFFIENCNNSQ